MKNAATLMFAWICGYGFMVLAEWMCSGGAK
jgi:hypothetical protein